MKRLVIVAALVAAAAFAQNTNVAQPDAGAPPPDTGGGDGGVADAGDGGVADADGGTFARLPPNEELARNDVHAATIHLQVARLYVEGLYDLAGRATTWNRERGLSLFTNAQNAVADAQRTLAELSGLAKGSWAKAAEPIRKARATLSHVDAQLRALAVPKVGASGQGPTGQAKIADVYNSLDSALKDVSAAAKAMDVDTKLRTP
jgi:hypothetical protein